jgi:hypothetical protein
MCFDEEYVHKMDNNQKCDSAPNLQNLDETPCFRWKKKCKRMAICEELEKTQRVNIIDYISTMYSIENTKK